MGRTYPIPFYDALLPVNHLDLEPGTEPVAYLAGPMRGYELHNFPAFAEGALILRRHGWRIENPAEYDLAAGINPAEADPAKWPITIRDMLQTDFRLILEQCNALILLPGWRESTGARLELAIAFYTGLPIFELVTVDGRLDLVDVDIESAVPQVIEAETLEHRTTRDGVVETKKVRL